MFTLDGLKSDSAAEKYVSGDFIRIFISTRYKPDGTVSDTYIKDEEWFNDNNGIFTRSNKDLDFTRDNVSVNIYGPLDRIYTVSLNENKTYEIKFGNGVTGRKLMPGDRIYVFYLESDGPAGQVDLSEIDFSNIQLRHDWNQLNGFMPQDIVDSMFNDDIMEHLFGGGEESPRLEVQPHDTVVTSFRPEEDVPEIRENAPGWFKTGNRLITARDTEFYLKTYSEQILGQGGIVDVKCMNNMQYVATFYKWLYENGIKSKDEPERKAERENGVDPGRYYLDNVTFNRTNFKYIDPADANNTYLWIKTESDMQDRNMLGRQDEINRRLYHLKTITTEYQIVKPVLVKFAICANPDLDDIKARYFSETDENFDVDRESYVEITLDDNMIYVSSNI